jgi:hypothetical protein
MATTPTHALRYPVLSDPANGPTAIGNLATDVDTKLPRLKAGQGGLVGSVPGATDRSMIIQGFTLVQVTNAGGASTFSYPQAFPNGVLSVVACSGDAIAGNHATVAINGTPNLSSFNTLHYQPNGALCSNVTVRVNVVAVGW